MPSPLARHILHEGLRGLTATATFPVAGGDPDEESVRRGVHAVAARPGSDSGRRWRRTSTGSGGGTGCWTTRGRPYYRWFAGGVLNTCYNALDLHIDRGRGKQRALVYDSPVTDTIKTFTFFELRDEVARAGRGAPASGHRQGRPGHHLHADGAGGGDRHAGLRAHRRRALGGVRRLRRPTSWPSGSTTPGRRLILSASCGIEVNRVIPYKPLLDGAIDMAASQGRALRHLPATAGARPRWWRDATSTGTTS